MQTCTSENASSTCIAWQYTGNIGTSTTQVLFDPGINTIIISIFWIIIVTMIVKTFKSLKI